MVRLDNFRITLTLTLPQMRIERLNDEIISIGETGTHVISIAMAILAGVVLFFAEPIFDHAIGENVRASIPYFESVKYAVTILCIIAIYIDTQFFTSYRGIEIIQSGEVRYTINSEYTDKYIIMTRTDIIRIVYTTPWPNHLGKIYLLTTHGKLLVSGYSFSLTSREQAVGILHEHLAI